MLATSSWSWGAGHLAAKYGVGAPNIDTSSALELVIELMRQDDSIAALEYADLLARAGPDPRIRGWAHAHMSSLIYGFGMLRESTQALATSVRLQAAARDVGAPEQRYNLVATYVQFVARSAECGYLSEPAALVELTGLEDEFSDTQPPLGSHFRVGRAAIGALGALANPERGAAADPCSWTLARRFATLAGAPGRGERPPGAAWLIWARAYKCATRVKPNRTALAWPLYLLARLCAEAGGIREAAVLVERSLDYACHLQAELASATVCSLGAPMPLALGWVSEARHLQQSLLMLGPAEQRTVSASVWRRFCAGLKIPRA